MIIVKADLLSAVSSDRDCSLCEVHIVNDATGSPSRGNYHVKLYGRHGRLIRCARVENWPRNDRPAWRLIQAAMKALG